MVEQSGNLFSFNSDNASTVVESYGCLICDCLDLVTLYSGTVNIFTRQISNLHIFSTYTPARSIKLLTIEDIVPKRMLERELVMSFAFVAYTLEQLEASVDKFWKDYAQSGYKFVPIGLHSFELARSLDVRKEWTGD